MRKLLNIRDVPITSDRRICRVSRDQVGGPDGVRYCVSLRGLQGPFGRLIIKKRQSGTNLLSKVPRSILLLHGGNP